MRFMTENRYAALALALLALGSGALVASWITGAPGRELFMYCLIGMLWARSAQQALIIRRLQARLPPSGEPGSPQPSDASPSKP